MASSTVFHQSREVFKRQKKLCLSGIDNSRKGSIDEAIVDLVCFINGQSNYFTLSSCSGRIHLFEENDPLNKKKGCEWLYTTHESCDAKQVLESLKKSCGNAVLKFEAFILHVRCYDIEAAQTLHSVAVMAGFRNSGLSVSKKGKIVVAVRSTHSLEVPLTHDGVLLVSEQYTSYICQLANDRMKENLRRTQKFFDNFKAAMISEVTAEKEQVDETAQKTKNCYKNSAAAQTSLSKTEHNSDTSEPYSSVLEEDLSELFFDDIH